MSFRYHSTLWLLYVVFLLVDKDIHFGWHFYNAWINDDFFHFCNFHDVQKAYALSLFLFHYFECSPVLFFFSAESKKNLDRLLYKIPSIYYICERCSVFCVRNWHNILNRMEWNNNKNAAQDSRFYMRYTTSIKIDHCDGNDECEGARTHCEQKKLPWKFLEMRKNVRNTHSTHVCYK